MSSSDYDLEQIQRPNSDSSLVEAIRKRPGMYIGGNDLFGFIHYFVSAVSFLLNSGARQIDFTLGDRLCLRSDTPVPTHPPEDGKIAPFNYMLPFRNQLPLEPGILAALSSELAVAITQDGTQQTLLFKLGELKSRETCDSEAPAGTELTFQPDRKIFTSLPQLSLSVFESYFQRLSLLHSGVALSIHSSQGPRRFFSENGLLDMFRDVAAPYQIMHTPIQIHARDGDLRIQWVMAYHSWKDDHLWCFINNGRAVEGGTHERGLRRALELLPKLLGLPETPVNGLMAVASIFYPDVVWAGCIKSKVANRELDKKVSRLVTSACKEWIASNPWIKDETRELQVFHFPEIWFRMK